MYGVSVEEIVEVNGLQNANEVAAGQILFVPAGGLPRPPPEPTPAAPTPATPALTASAAGLVWPVDGVVLRDFEAGRSRKPVYEGILIAAPAHTVVRSATAGVVAFAGNQGTNLGAMVIVDDGTGMMTIYGHLGRLGVKDGDHVAQGAAIGEVGTSGLLGASPRLYFQVRRDKEPVDPLPLLPD